MEQEFTIQMSNSIKRMPVLGEPIKQTRKQVLNNIIEERTPPYISLNNPQYDKKLMEAHLELATIYNSEGNYKNAISHFKEAQHEFFNMSLVETKNPQYISGGKEGFQKYKKQKEVIEQNLEGYKTMLIKTANMIGYDPSTLMFIPTSDNPKKNLVDLVA